MSIQDNLRSTLVVLLDSCDLSRSLTEITDATFDHIDIICHEKHIERMKTWHREGDILNSVNNIEYEQYAGCLNQIKNIRGIIDAIAVSSANEKLIEIAAKLRTDLKIPRGLQENVVSWFVDKYEMKKRAMAAGIRTLITVDAMVQEAKRLVARTGWPLVLKPRTEKGFKGVQLLKNDEDLELGEEINAGEYFIEQFMDGETFTVDGAVESGKIQFMAVFHEKPGRLDFYQNRIPQTVVLVGDPKSREKIEIISNDIVAAFGYVDGVFHLELLKNKIDDEFYFIEFAPRPSDGTATKLMAKFGADLIIQMIRTDVGLQLEVVQLPEHVYIGAISVPTPASNRSFVFDSVNLPAKHHYRTLIEIEAPPAQHVMREYDTINAYFSSTSQSLVQEEMNRAKESLKVMYRTTDHVAKANIDLRSDTLTTPTEGMKQAMICASDSDAAFDENDTVRELEDYCALLLGKEAALFIPTGTMSNQIVIRAHTQPGDEIITDALYHINFYESAQTAALGGVTLNLIHATRGLITVNDIEKAINSKPRNRLYAKPAVIFLENTVSASGGAVFPIEQLRTIQEYAKLHNLAVHMDGARLLNACITCNSRPCEIAAYVDSVAMCFAKGLGAPFGSIIAGNRDFIQKVKLYRKWFGGTLHQSGYMAAAALYSLNENWETILKRDHDHAKLIEAELLKIIPRKNLYPVETNIVIVELDDIIDDKNLMLDALMKQGVLAFPWSGNSIRFVTSRNISVEQAITAAKIIRNVFENFMRHM